MMNTCWEAGVHCEGCGNLIELGDEMLYGKCITCGRKAAQARNEAPATPQETLDFARACFAEPGRIVFTRRQLRVLLALVTAVPEFRPVRRPDKGKGLRWYGRINGWDPARVEAGLSPAETAGLWLDYLEVGRIPPIKHADLARVLDLISASTPEAGNDSVLSIPSVPEEGQRKRCSEENCPCSLFSAALAGILA